MFANYKFLIFFRFYCVFVIACTSWSQIHNWFEKTLHIYNFANQFFMFASYKFHIFFGSIVHSWSPLRANQEYIIESKKSYIYNFAKHFFMFANYKFSFFFCFYCVIVIAFARWSWIHNWIEKRLNICLSKTFIYVCKL